MDPATAVALASAGASLFGGLFGKDSASSNASSAIAFNREEAEKNRAFQLSAFQNRHQWEVADLKAAGLNPILSAGGQPPIPSGSSASNPQPDFGASDRRTRRMELMMNSAKVASEVLLNKSLAGKADADADAARGSIGLFGSKVPISRIPSAMGLGGPAGFSAKSVIDKMRNAFRRKK